MQRMRRVLHIRWELDMIEKISELRNKIFLSPDLNATLQIGAYSFFR